MVRGPEYKVNCALREPAGCQVDVVIEPPLPPRLYRGLAEALRTSKAHFLSPNLNAADFDVTLQPNTPNQSVVQVQGLDPIAECQKQVTTHDMMLAIRVATETVGVLKRLGAKATSTLPKR